MMKAIIGCALVLVSAAPASASTVMATCGRSDGMAYYEHEGRWSDDHLSTGSWKFVFDDKGNPNVIFRDSSGRETDSAADGARLIVSFIHPELHEFGVVSIYAEAGVVETYNVIEATSGKRRLFWTTNRAMSSRFPKVSAYVSDCE